MGLFKASSGLVGWITGHSETFGFGNLGMEYEIYFEQHKEVAEGVDASCYMSS